MTPEPEFKPDHPTLTREAWQRRLDRIPAIYRDNTIERFTARTREYLEATTTRSLIDDFKDGHGLIIAGPVGTNKTRLACHLAMMTMAATWQRAAFLSAANIRARALADWGGAAEIIEEACKLEILILDDLGKGAPMATVDEIIFSILDQRTSWRKQTFITTNYDPTTLQQRFKEPETGRAIMRRISEFNRPFQP